MSKLPNETVKMVTRTRGGGIVKIQAPLKVTKDGKSWRVMIICEHMAWRSKKSNFEVTTANRVI